MPPLPAGRDRTLTGAIDVVDVEISIVSHKDQSLVRRCLRSLPPSCSGYTWRATVVENLPRAGPSLEEEFPWVRVIANPSPLGFGANHTAVLLPIARSRAARYVVVLNDDTELSPGSLTAMIGYADGDSTVGAVGPLLLEANGDPQQSMYEFPTVAGMVRHALLPGALSCRPIESGRGWLSGACLLIRSAAAETIGLFDTRFFMFYEDVDLAARLWESGWSLAVCRGARVVHFNHQTVSQPELRRDMERQMLRSCFLYFRKHRGPAAAGAVLLAWRASLLARGLRRMGRAYGTPASTDRSSALELLRLASYRPTRPLAHETGPPPA